jgi:hypothetical protein
LPGPFAQAGEPRLIAETKEGGFEVFAFACGGSRFLYWMTDEEGADIWSYGMDFYIAGGPEPVKTGVVTLTGGQDNTMALSSTANTLAAAVGGDHITYQEHGLALVDISDDLTQRSSRSRDRSSAPSTPLGRRPDGDSSGRRDRMPTSWTNN